MLLRGTTVALQCGVYKAAHISSCRPIPDPNMRVSIAYLAVAVANGVCSSCMVVAVAGRLTCDVQHTRWGVCHCWSAGESVPRYGYVLRLVRACKGRTNGPADCASTVDDHVAQRGNLTRDDPPRRRARAAVHLMSSRSGRCTTYLL